MPYTPKRINTDALREIKKTMSRFLSLFLLSALAVAFLAGLRTTAPDMEYTADLYYDRTHLMDVRILSTLGLTEADIDALSAADEVEKAEGAWYVDGVVHAAANDLIVRFHSLSAKGINTPELLEGRLPQRVNECVVEPALLTEGALSIGDVIYPDMEGTDYAGSLKNAGYTIVGTVHSSLYMSRDRGTSTIGTGRLSAVAFLPREAFDLEYYTEAYLLARGGEELLCYGDVYGDKIDVLVDTLEELGETRAGLRYDEVIGEALEKLSDAQKEYDEGEAEARAELADAQKKLADARKELDDGWKDYYEGKNTLDEELEKARKKLNQGQRKLEQGKARYDAGLVEYEAGLAKYETGLKQYEAGKAELESREGEYARSLAALTAGQGQYDAGLAEYESGLAQYQTGLEEIVSVEGTMAAAQEKLAQSSAQLSQGQQEYDQGLAQYREGRAAYQEMQAGYDRLEPLLGSQQGLDQLVQMAKPPLADMVYPGANGKKTFCDVAYEAVEGLVRLLQGIQSQLDPASADAAQLRYLLGQLPANQDEFVMAATDPIQSAGLKTALSRGYDIVGRTCAATEATLRTSKSQLDAAKAQLDEGWAQYSAGKEELEQGQGTLTASRQALAQVKGQLDAAKRTLDASKKELDEGWAQLSDGRRQLDQGWEVLAASEKELDGVKATLEAAKAELDQGLAAYETGLAGLESGKAELTQATREGRRELDWAWDKLMDGEKEYAEGLLDYEKGRSGAEAELSDARRELNDARRDIAEIEDCKWYVLSRETNMGYVSYQMDAQRMGNLAQVFPLIFFLVAALVCLTTMTRMVEEQRVQIGSLKALGYSRFAISKKYVGYGLLSSLGGGLVGLAVGCTLIPTIIFNAWKVMYTVGDLHLSFEKGTYALAVGAAVFCVTGTALWTSFATLTAVPATLMRPRAPQAGKRVLLERIGPVWRRLSFTWKVTVRNLFRYKKRFVMAVVGIGGCTALLITGFGLRDSIHGFFNIQYDELTTYHGSVSLKENLTADELLEIGRELDGHPLVESWTTVSSQQVTVESDSGSMDGYTYLYTATEEDKFGTFVHLKDYRTGESLPLTDDGAVITQKLSEQLKVGVGDTITVVEDNVPTEVPVTGITENYIYHYVYLSHDGYVSHYGHQPEVNSIMVRYLEDTQDHADAVASRLLPLAGVSSVSRTDAMRQSVLRGLEGVDYAVIVVVVAAAALAFVVLYNLTNINITERLRELATLKVLGFYDREMSDYVYRENILLTFFGILLGLGMGKYLHRWLVMTVEIDMAMFYRSAKPLSYVLAAILTVVFSALVNLAAKGRLRKIDMVESLKTVE